MAEPENDNIGGEWPPCFPFCLIIWSSIPLLAGVIFIAVGYNGMFE